MGKLLYELDVDELGTGVHGLARLDEQLIHHAVGLRLDLILHLHGLENEQPRPLAHGVAHGHEDADDPARHERFDHPAAADLVLAAFAACGEWIDHLHAHSRVAEGDLVHVSFTVVDQRELRTVLEPERADVAAHLDEIGVHAAIADADA